jgi:hypothetical protein
VSWEVAKQADPFRILWPDGEDEVVLLRNCSLVGPVNAA